MTLPESRPRIGIVSGFDRDRDAYHCGAEYVRAIRAAGGLPTLLPYLLPDDTPEILSGLDGVLLSGGPDFPTSRYGEPEHPTVQVTVPERDAFEFALTRVALDLNVPTLGVCRGMQTMNVVAGGTLFVDILSMVPGALDHRDGTPLEQTCHTIEVREGSVLGTLVASRSTEVNSHHHQAVRDVAPMFGVTAVSQDGLVEGIESSQHPFALGVQWHPERLWEGDGPSRRIFEAFVTASAASRASNPLFNGMHEARREDTRARA